MSRDQTKSWQSRNSNFYPRPEGHKADGGVGRNSESALEQVAGLVHHLGHRLHEQAQGWNGLSQSQRVETILTILREI